MDLSIFHFYFLRYMTEHCSTEEPAVSLNELRSALGLSEQDFEKVDSQLLALKFIDCTAGPDGIRWLLLSGRQYVENMRILRYSLTFFEEKLFYFLVRSCRSKPACSLQEICSGVGSAQEDIEDALTGLEDIDFIKVLYADDKPFEVMVTKAGRLALRNNLLRSGSSTSISVTGNNNIIGDTNTLIQGG